ncbi:GIDE domain-containing protein [Nocardioides ochotonae]|uniref:GIDE domain-containing protein n=1 Tax=Nocardioides ochotonae TaxID=2685869 RepID=UPI00140D682B|nr:GIDE domain-containing protein [Nocardioides ochotonae]
MTSYLIATLVAAVVAVGLGYLAHEARGARQRLRGTETSTTATLTALAGAASAAAGSRSYAERVELSGVAAPGPQGLLTSEISGTPCVWHHHKVSRRYEERRRTSGGEHRTQTRTEVVTENRSREPFVLRDEHGEVLVVPETAVDRPRKVRNEFRPETGRGGPSITIGSLSLAMPASRETLGYEYEEWVLTPGTPLFVQGEATDRDGRLAVRDSPSAPLVISTRSEAELQAAHTRRALLCAGGSGLAAVAAVVMLILGLLA